MVVFNASKTQLLHLSTRHNLPHNYHIFFENTQLKPSSVLNILGISFSRDLSWKDHNTSLSKQASKRLGVLRITLRHPSCSLFTGVLFAPVWSMLHTFGVVPLIQLSLRRLSLGLFVSSTLLLLLTLSKTFLPVEL